MLASLAGFVESGLHIMMDSNMSAPPLLAVMYAVVGEVAVISQEKVAV